MRGPLISARVDTEPSEEACQGLIASKPAF
uniref:Uncharacterized protein n=1 Tax=Musa acuminata subsp. malaccensis TaxID=214687 RepID=A0A804I0D3_MUSAM